MASATQEGAEVMAVGAYVESLGAVNAEPDDGKRDLQDFVFVDANATWGAVDYFAFSCQFIKRNAIFLDGRNHWRDLVEFPGEFLEGCLDLGLIEGGHGFALENLSGGILSVGRLTEFERSLVLLVLGHKEVLNAGGSTDDEHQEAGGNGVEGSAVAYLALPKAATHEVDDIVGGSTGRFIDQEEAIELRGHEIR